MKGSDIHRWKEANEAMHSTKQRKLRLGERRPERTVRREFKGSSKSSDEQCKKEKSKS